MYRPPPFREDRRDTLYQAMRDHPLATLITAGPEGPKVSLVPFLLRTGGEGDVLCAHLARGNDQLAQLAAGSPALVLFQGPQGYVSPSWYATKQVHGRVVPTWNYISVEARGVPRIIEDDEWLRAQLAELTDAQETGRDEPWRVSDAPEDYLAALLKGIVGIEIPIDRIEGTWKLSQNQPVANREGVVAGLVQDGQDALAEAVARAARPA